MTAGLFILAVMASVGLKLASHPETSVGLQAIRVIQRSEHSHPGPTKALAGIRIRLSPSDFGYEIQARDATDATEHKVPQISVATQ
jgi:hypothetical protein